MWFLCNPGGWIAKRLRLPPIIEAHSQDPGVSQAPGNDQHHLGTALRRVFFLLSTGGGVVVGWALRNGGRGYGLALWSVTKGWVGVKCMVKKRYVTLEWPLNKQQATNLLGQSVTFKYVIELNSIYQCSSTAIRLLFHIRPQRINPIDPSRFNNKLPCSPDHPAKMGKITVC